MKDTPQVKALRKELDSRITLYYGKDLAKVLSAYGMCGNSDAINALHKARAKYVCNSNILDEFEATTKHIRRDYSSMNEKVYVRNGGKFQEVDFRCVGGRKPYFRSGRAFIPTTISNVRTQRVLDLRDKYRNKYSFDSKDRVTVMNDILSAYCMVNNFQAEKAFNIAWEAQITTRLVPICAMFEDILSVAGIQF